jgi:hypothetical protein
MATVITGNTQLSASKNNLIIGMVQRELKFAAKLLPFISDFSMFAQKGMKQIQVPKMGSFTVQNRASGVDGDVSALTVTTDVLNLDQKNYISWIVDSADEIESSIAVQAEYIKRASAAHGRKIDELILAAAQAAATDFGAGVTYANMLAMNTFLKKNDALMDQVVIIASPDAEEDLMSLDEFKRADVYGAPVIPNGLEQVGKIFGRPVMIHNGLTGSKVLAFEKSGLGYAFQQQPNVARQPEVGYGTSAERVAIDLKMGVAALQLGEKGLLATESPLIAGILS